MKKNFLLLITLLAFLPFYSLAQNNRADSTEKMVTTAKQVLMRAVGMKSLSFQFERIPSEKGLDVYEVIALGGKVQVKGSSTIAMTRGAYDYIRKACNIQYTWSSDVIKLPRDLPDYTIPRTVSPYKYRQYYNVNTFGYSTAFWHFADWEKELDWMALHGINMPLALFGQEAVWQKVYTDMGMTKDELSVYFTGPAFLPWLWMGKITRHDGPLPQSYIDKTSELQRQLLIRMRELGMQPVVPGFSGNVPAAYARLNPAAKLSESTGWNNFPAENKSYTLAPGSDEYATLTKSFINEYKRFYGDVNYFLVELLNGNKTPSFSATSKFDELSLYGKSVSDAITAADADGVWVMHSTLFSENDSYWDKASVKAFLSKIPNNKMLIIDLVDEKYSGWNKHEAFYGKPWIFSTVNNYGGNSKIAVNLNTASIYAPAMLASTKKGNITGYGISPEGIENNEIVYELSTQMAWSSKPTQVKSYMGDFVKERYGSADSVLRIAWLMLLSTSDFSTQNPLNLYQVRPPQALGVRVNNSDFDLSAELFIKSIDKFASNANFKFDLAQVITAYAGTKVDILLQRAIELHKQGSAAESKRAFDRAFELLLMMDGLTYTMPDQRLEKLIDNARKYGNTVAEGDYYEADAKRQLTQWGNNDTPTLHENGSKIWSGLIRDYYLGRWSAYAKSLQLGQNIDFNEWEYNWINTPGLLSKAPTTGNITTFAKSLYNAANEYIVENTSKVRISASYIGNNKASVSLLPENSSLKMTYSTDGSDAWANSTQYSFPFEVTLPATIKAIAYKDNAIYGQTTVLKLPVSYGKPVSLSVQPAEKYKATGGSTLTDGKKSSGFFDDGYWIGFEGINVTAQVLLEQKQKISKVTFSYLEDQQHLVFAPSSAIVETSADGITYKSAGIYDFNVNAWPLTSKIAEKTISFPETEASYVRILFLSQGNCPANHKDSGKKPWFLIDEITVE